MDVDLEAQAQAPNRPAGGFRLEDLRGHLVTSTTQLIGVAFTAAGASNKAWGYTVNRVCTGLNGNAVGILFSVFSMLLLVRRQSTAISVFPTLTFLVMLGCALLATSFAFLSNDTIEGTLATMATMAFSAVFSTLLALGYIRRWITNHLPARRG